MRRQLALAIQMHEAAHYTLFRTRWLNETVADWLAARPMWNDVARYREHHMRHHAHTGSETDPDLSLVRPFPTTRRSLARKFARDLAGISTVKRIIGLFLMDIGVFHYTVAAEVIRRPRDGRTRMDYVREGLRNMLPFVIMNLVFAGILAACGILWTYWAWVAAYFTSFSLFVRIRSLAEHACTEMSEDPLRNTRTTLASVLARMTVAPMNVNYHLEHHLLASVPYYRLPQMHRVLRERSGIVPATGYGEVLRLASAAG